jgi:hypothetical protein
MVGHGGNEVAGERRTSHLDRSQSEGLVMWQKDGYRV